MADDLGEVSNQVLADRLREAARRVEDGKAAQKERGQIIDELARRGRYTQEEIAEMAGMTQQAVSQRINRPAKGDTTE